MSLLSFRRDHPQKMDLASDSCLGRKVKVTTLSDRHCLSIVWNKVTSLSFTGLIDMRSCQRVTPEIGSC
jgi:hypothetical protein